MLESNKLKKSLAKIKCVDKAHAKSLGFFLKVAISFITPYLVSTRTLGIQSFNIQVLS